MQKQMITENNMQQLFVFGFSHPSLMVKQDIPVALGLIFPSGNS
jgi:hypothetical protein